MKLKSGNSLDSSAKKFYAAKAPNPTYISHLPMGENPTNELQSISRKII